MSAPQEVSGRYKLERRLGAGGMSTVFLAMDEVLERQVAVKLLAEHLAEDETFVARFRNEALAAARLQHPNVVQVFDSGLDQPSDRHFIVMEFVEGPSCADLLRENKQLDIEEAVAYVRDACQGLDYAHRAGVIHRDVKPGNLLVVGETGTVKLADFGIAKAAEQTRITQVGSVLGTAAYLSPEQARGEEAGPASDIYSLGVCAYQFLAGRLPHEYASLTELALKQQQEPIEPIAVHRPDVPPELDKAIRLCLEPEVSSRYSNALELADALAAGLHGQDTDVTRALERSTQLMAADDATSVLPVDATGATRALRRDSTRVAPVPVPVGGRDRTRARGAQVPQAAASDADKNKRRKRLGNLLVVLLVLGAGVAAALAVLSADGGGSGGGDQPIDEPDVPAQVQALEDLIRENTE